MSKKCPHMNFSTTFNPVVGITQKFINNAQNILINDFGNPNILPVPDVVQDDVPRVIMSSNGGHSQIVLSKINCSLTTNFDENYSDDVKKCIKYFGERVDIVNQMINALDRDNSLVLNFLGITTGLIFDKDDAVDLLRKNITKIQINDICDIDLQITRIVEDRYYVNIRIANTRLFSQNINPLACGFLENEYHNGIMVTIDVNNRYAFSKGLTRIKECSLKEIEKIKTLTEDTINSLADIFGDDVFNE